MLVMGVDENGLGPRLGPLVATSLTLETPRYGRSALCERGLRLGLTDSKETGGFGRMGFTESVAWTVVRQHICENTKMAHSMVIRIELSLYIE